MGGFKTKSTSSPAFFLPQDTHGSLCLLIFFFAPLQMGAFSQANHSHPHMSWKQNSGLLKKTLPCLFKYAVPGLKYIKPLYQSTYTNVKWRAKKKELIKNLEACNHLEAQIGGNL